MKTKRVLSLLLAVILLFAAVPTAPVQAANAAFWDWETENYFEGWSHNSQIDATCVANGWYTLHIPGTNDPFITSPSVSINASTYHTLTITYCNQTGNTEARLYWKNAGEGFSQAKSLGFTTIADGQDHTLEIDLSQSAYWTGTVAQLRFDPTTGGTGNFAIESLTIGAPAASVTPTVKPATEWQWDTNGDTLGWTANEQMQALSASGGSLVMQLNGRSDPNITSPALSISASTYKTLSITYRNHTGNANARLYWKTAGNGFSESKAVGFMTIADGEVHTLNVDLSQNSGWSGTIAQVRFDPTTGGSGNFEIESLAFTTTVQPAGKLSQKWQWESANDTLGWTANEQMNAVRVENGRLVMNLNGCGDPNITSPTMSLDASNYQYLELIYRNDTDNTTARLYWTKPGEGWSEFRAYGFSTIADGKWHTLRLDLSEVSGWSGTITQLRLDPTTGGSGDFALDQVALLDKPGRYTLENGYFYLSGTTGLIDTLCFDPTGSGNYCDDLIGGNMFLTLDYAGTSYSGTSPNVTWSVTDDALEIQNIQFSSSGLSGIWTIRLDGAQLDSSFAISSNADGKSLKNVGFVMDMLWENNGYDVEADPAGSLKVPFSKMVASSDRYHSAYAFKRMTIEDPDTLGLDGEWIDWQGANGFDFNLRFLPDTEYISPLCSVDNLRLYFRKPDKETVTINNGETFTRTLTIELSESNDITPEHFAAFSGEDSAVTTALNEMMYEFGYAREAACTNPDWWEWVSLTRAWRNDNYLAPDVNKTTNVRQNSDGYIWTWGENEGWPFPTDRDSKHYLMTTANYINAVYNYYIYNGDMDYLNANIGKMRLGMNFLLGQYDEQSRLFIISHSDHNGTNTSIGSNYWDITPYGYKSAYDNIYCYLALMRMAELEQMLGNQARATELSNYANDLKIGYNNAFWTGSHYIQTIDVNGTSHDYGCVYLNLEAINYGLADSAQATTIMNYLSNTKTSSGKADTFTAFEFAPRVTMFNNVHNSKGGWYVAIYNSSGVFGTDQIQNGGSIFYTMYYELMCRLKTYGADDAYSRLETMVDRFNIEHLQGANPLYYGEKNQHPSEGNVSLWGEFPESGLVPVAAKDGFMGIQADSQGLHVTPNLPSSGMTSLSLDGVDYWGMSLEITVTNTSVRIRATENNSQYSDWTVNGTEASGLFDITITIEPGETVTLARAQTASEG